MAQTKSNKGKIIFWSLLGVVVAGGGFFIWWKYFKIKKPSKAELDKADADAKAAAALAAKTGLDVHKDAAEKAKQEAEKLVAAAQEAEKLVAAAANPIGKTAMAKQDTTIFNKDSTVYRKAKKGEWIGEITDNKATNGS